MHVESQLVVLSLAPVCLLIIRIQSYYAKKLALERASDVASTSHLVN